MRNQVWSYSLTSHSEIKDYLLQEIDKSVGNSVVDSTIVETKDKDLITKTDFFQKKENFYTNSYILKLHSEFKKEFYNVLMDYYCAENFNLDYAWYQQYKTGDLHDWHFHPTSNISFVYFLELNSYKESTQFFDIKKRKIFQPKVKEGDVIVFPSFTPHRSPRIKTKNRKTVISGNMNLKYVNFSIVD